MAWLGSLELRMAIAAAIMIHAAAIIMERFGGRRWHGTARITVLWGLAMLAWLLVVGLLLARDGVL